MKAFAMVFGFSLAVSFAATAAVAGEAKITRNDTSVTISDGDRQVLSYRFGGVPYKPYVAELYSPGGTNVLRDAPHDHLHHHALMFAIGVDGTSFWEEFPQRKPGRQMHRAIETTTATQPDRRLARLVQRLDWIAGDETKTLTERRTIEAHLGAPAEPTLLTWRSKLAAEKDQVTLGGSHYYGLGMRFVESMDQGGTFVNSAGDLGEVVRGTERLGRADWCAYTAVAEGRPVTVAMFHHASNPRPARFFTMTKPFAYLSATINLWKEPLVLKQGESLELCYGVALWDGEIDADKIEQEYHAWQARIGVERP
jgi:hypothetical protein